MALVVIIPFVYHAMFYFTVIFISSRVARKAIRKIISKLLLIINKFEFRLMVTN